MSRVLDQYVWDALQLLATFQFSSEYGARLRSAPVITGRLASLVTSREVAILIPSDIPSPLHPEMSWKVPFGATELTVWNPIGHPGPDWSPVPAGAAPLWWRNNRGALLPAWNLWSNVRDLLTFREDREVATRDAHGRLPADSSPRAAARLLDIPAANDANAALLDAALSLNDGVAPRLSLPYGATAPVGVALSHDCDQLRGNDVYSQGIRLVRAAEAVARGRWRRAGRHLRASIQNSLEPDRFFAGNLRGMLDLERQFEFRSVSYFLTGAGGRYGARSGDSAAVATARALPVGWEAGVHYNYHTLKSAAALDRELAIVRSARGPAPVIAGRAHYLTFDPLKSPAFLEHRGIRYDESVGWAGQLSYKSGVAGPVRLYDASADRVLDVVEMPMMCMDSTLVATGGMEQFAAMQAHLRVVGGVLSVLFHPGTLYNPEQPEFEGLYHKILSSFFADGARSWTPSEVLSEASAFSSSTPVRS